jgi:hypothetical protein
VSDLLDIAGTSSQTSTAAPASLYGAPGQILDVLA